MVTLRGDDKHYDHKVVRIFDLVAEKQVRLAGFTFDGCDIFGPAVLFPHPNTIVDGCNFDGTPDSIIWDWTPERERICGVIELDACEFHNCRFTNIGIAAPPPLAKLMREAFAA